MVSNLTRTKFIPDISEEEVQIIQSPVDTEKFKKKSSLEDEDQILRVVSIGNYQKRKGFNLIIEIAKELKKNHPSSIKIEFHILGRIYPSARNYFANLKKEIESNNLNNIFLYTSDEMGVNEFLNNKSVFLMTSFKEASPFVVWEAASTELPIISTDVGDVKQFLEKYQCGFVINNRDPKEFAQKINFFHDSSNRKVFGKKARLMALSEFDFKVSMNKYRKVYEEGL